MFTVQNRKIKALRSLNALSNALGNALVRNTIVATLLLNSSLMALADTRIRGEFEYNVDDQALSGWRVGPVFSLDEATELEIPIGQNDRKWRVQPELSYEIPVNDFFELELSIGAKVSENEPVQGFGSIESSFDF